MLEGFCFGFGFFVVFFKQFDSGKTIGHPPDILQ